MHVRLDKKFDRYVTQNAQIPLTWRGQLGIGNNRYEGFIKCKLAHANYGSFVVPDFLFVGKGPALAAVVIVQSSRTVKVWKRDSV
jgi:hypothetical protein